MNAATELGFQHVYEPSTGDWTLLLLHGTGGDEHDLVGLGRQLAPSAALLSPRGKVLENGMPRFFRRSAAGQLDIPDLLVRTDELAAFVTAAVQSYGRDPGKVAAVGFSNGANIAVSLLLRHPALLGAAALLRPMLPYEPEGALTLPGTDVLIAAGEGDPYSSPEQTRRLAEVLSTGGANVTVHVEPRAGHGLGSGDLRALEQWAAPLGGV
jgi:predicted esterase